MLTSNTLEGVDIGYDQYLVMIFKENGDLSGASWFDGEFHSALDVCNEFHGSTLWDSMELNADEWEILLEVIFSQMITNDSIREIKFYTNNLEMAANWVKDMERLQQLTLIDNPEWVMLPDNGGKITAEALHVSIVRDVLKYKIWVLQAVPLTPIESIYSLKKNFFFDFLRDLTR